MVNESCKFYEDIRTRPSSSGAALVFMELHLIPVYINLGASGFWSYFACNLKVYG